mgnify:CR=1 FL=1
MNYKNVLYIGGALILLYALYRLLQKFNIIDDVTDTKADILINDPLFFQNEGQKLVSELTKKLGRKPTVTDMQVRALSSSKMLALTNEVINAKGFVNDSEEEIYTVFKNFSTQFQVYYFSQFFKAKTNKDLIAFISDFMNNTELSKVYDIIKKLPRF